MYTDIFATTTQLAHVEISPSGAVRAEMLRFDIHPGGRKQLTPRA